MDDVGDIISFGPDRPRRPARWLIAVGLVALSGVALSSIVIFASRHDVGGRPASPPAAPRTDPSTGGPAEPPGPACPPVGWAQRPAPAQPVAGLRIDQAGAGSGIDRCDRTAVDGPWTVVVHGPGGSLGRQGAVVTFPAEQLRTGRGVTVGDVTGTAGNGTVTWPVARNHARVRGDLSESHLIAIAARTRIVDGHPSVEPPAGFTVVASGPYRPPTIHEMRYGSAAVGERAALGGGIAYTGVTSGGGFEDQLYALPSRQGGPVAGRPAVVSSVFGGNATLAWEPAPGLVAYVGYSGTELDDAAIAALHRLAERTRPLGDSEWRAVNPLTAEQTNAPG